MLTTEQLNELVEILMSSENFLDDAEESANLAERRAEDSKDYANEAMDYADSASASATSAQDFAEEAVEYAQSAQSDISSAKDELERARSLLSEAQTIHNAYGEIVKAFADIQNILLKLPQQLKEDVRKLGMEQREMETELTQATPLTSDDLDDLNADESEDC